MEYLTPFLNFSSLYYLHAVYSMARSIFVLSCTPAIATSSPNKNLFDSRRRLLSLHGFNLAVRWGYGLLWLIATGSLTLNEYSTIVIPLELRNIDSDYKIGLILLSFIVAFFDWGLSRDHWNAMIESSSVPSIKRDVALFTIYPFADILSRGLSFVIDFTFTVGIVSLMFKFSILKDLIAFYTPADCDGRYFYYIISYLVLASVLRLLGSGNTLGNFFAGIEVVKSDGKSLDFSSSFEREIYFWFCSSSVISPIVLLTNDENASIVDLISNTREIDTMAKTLHSDNHIYLPLSSKSKELVSPSPNKITESKPKQQQEDGALDKKKTTASKAKTPAKAPVSSVVVKSTEKSSKKVAKISVQEVDDEEEEKPQKNSRKIPKTPKKRVLEEDSSNLVTEKKKPRKKN